MCSDTLDNDRGNVVLCREHFKVEHSFAQQMDDLTCGFAAILPYQIQHTLLAKPFVVAGHRLPNSVGWQQKEISGFEGCRFSARVDLFIQDAKRRM